MWTVRAGVGARHTFGAQGNISFGSRVERFPVAAWTRSDFRSIDVEELGFKVVAVFRIWIHSPFVQTSAPLLKLTMKILLSVHGI